MPDTEQPQHAPVFWAQRSNLIYLRVAVEDCERPEVHLEPNKVTFSGRGGNPKREYCACLDLFGTIKVDESRWENRSRGAEFVLVKEQNGYWKRLLKEERKCHWVRVDFAKWKDEDDSDGEGGGEPRNDTDFEEMMRQMGGLGGAGGMGGMGGMPPLDEDEDSDNDAIPELN